MSIESRKHQYGKIFDHWRIMESLGTGSNGKSAVFRLEHISSPHVESALKVITLVEDRGSFDDLTDARKAEYQNIREELTQSAEQEVLLMNQFQGNTHIVDYLDHTFADWSDSGCFGRDMLVRMERLSDLRGKLSQGQLFSREETIKVGKDICRALILCHRKNVVHRDIKPENIFVNKDGNYKLGDFGISRILDSSSFQASTGIGTPQYWAPEQISGRYDQRVDLYSLGLVLYELSNHNRLPFATSSYVREAEIQKRMLGTPLPSPTGADETLSGIILKACAYRPEDRYQSAEEFLYDLNGLSSPIHSYATVPAAAASPVPPSTGPAHNQYRTEPAANQYRTEPAHNPYSTEPAYGQYSTDPAQIRDENQTVYAQSQRKSTPAPLSDPHEPNRRSISPLLPLSILLGIVCLLLLFFLLRPGQKDSTTPETQTPNASAITEAPVTQAPEIPSTEPPETQITEPPAPTPREITARIMAPTDRIGAGGRHSVVIKNNGEAIAEGDSQNGAVSVGNWSNLIAVSSGDFFTMGLRSDGTVVATGEYQYCVQDWENVVAIVAGDTHCVGLLENGTVVASGDRSNGKCDVQRLNNAVTPERQIIAIGASYDHTVVLYSDGTVDGVGDNAKGQLNVYTWTDVVAVYAGVKYTIGLRSDGTVLYTGDTYVDKYTVESWRDVAMISAGDFHVVALTTDGRILTQINKREHNVGQCDLSAWYGEEIVAIGAGCRHTVAITADGRILAKGEDKFGQCQIDGYTLK